MIDTAPCVMFLMCANTLRGQVGGGWALEIERFLGPVKWHRADRRVPLWAQKTRELLCCIWTWLSSTACAAPWKWMGCMFLGFFDFFCLFRNGFACFGCFDTGPKHKNKLKKCFWLRETNKNTTETDWVSVYFVRATLLYSSVPQPETGTPKLFWRGTERVKPLASRI